MAVTLTNLSSFTSSFLDGQLNPLLTHVILLGGAIFAEFSVAAGIILEAPKEKTFREWLGMALVLGGVLISSIFTIGLFVFDEGISRTQEATIAELERKLAPRELSSSEIEFLKATLGPYKDRTISVWSYGLDLESGRLARQILSALESANVPTVNSIGHMISSWEPRLGVIVTGPDEPLVNALIVALKPVSAEHGPRMAPGQAATVAPAEIFVGLKPVPK